MEGQWVLALWLTAAILIGGLIFAIKPLTDGRVDIPHWIVEHLREGGHGHGGGRFATIAGGLFVLFVVVVLFRAYTGSLDMASARELSLKLGKAWFWFLATLAVAGIAYASLHGWAKAVMGAMAGLSALALVFVLFGAWGWLGGKPNAKADAAIAAAEAPEVITRPWTHGFYDSETYFAPAASSGKAIYFTVLTKDHAMAACAYEKTEGCPVGRPDTELGIQRVCRSKQNVDEPVGPGTICPTRTVGIRSATEEPVKILMRDFLSPNA